MVLQHAVPFRFWSRGRCGTVCPAEQQGPDWWTEVPLGCVSLVALGKAPWRLEEGMVRGGGLGRMKTPQDLAVPWG